MSRLYLYTFEIIYTTERKQKNREARNMKNNQNKDTPPPPEDVKVTVTRSQQIPAAQQPEQNSQAQQQQGYPPYPQYPYYYPYQQYYPPQSQEKSDDLNKCPTCGKAGYFYPYAPLKSKKPKKFLGLSAGIWVIIIILFLVFGCAIANIFFYPGGPYDETHTFSTKVIIAEGGHYRHSIGEYYYSDEVKATLDLSSNGGQTFDVYIMNKDQYDNAYGSPNTTGMAFSSLFGWENINRLNDTSDLTEEYQRADDVWGYDEYGGLYLVIDNRDNILTFDDSSPQGTITVNLHIKVKTVSSSSYYF